MKFSNTLKILGIVVLCVQGCLQNDSNNVSLTQQEIKIGGSVETYEILEELAEVYQEKSQAVEFKFLPNSQTSGGIQGVKDKIVDIGAVGRPLTTEEQSQALEYQLLAQNALVVVTHQSIGNVTDLTTEQLQGIYRGEIKNWQEIGGENAPIFLIDIPEDESEKQLLREHYLGEDLEVTPDAILLTDDAQALDAIATTKYSIGTIPISEEIAALPVNVLSLDGIEPTSENIEDGHYKMTQILGMVFASDRVPPVGDFIDFILSEAGRETIEEFTDDD